MNDLKIWTYDDTFNPVTDLNENFEIVKSAIESLESGAGTDEQEISDLKTKVGSDTLVTTAQDLSGAINELDDDLNHASTGIIARLTSAENNIGTLQTQAGNATLVTSAQTLSGAVNELDDDLNHADTGIIARVGTLENRVGFGNMEAASTNLSAAINERYTEYTVYELDGDGDRTWAQAIGLVRTFISTLGYKQKIHTKIRIGDYIYSINDIHIEHYGSFYVDNNGRFQISCLHLTSGHEKFAGVQIEADGTVTMADHTNNTQDLRMQVKLYGYNLPQ